MWILLQFITVIMIHAELNFFVDDALAKFSTAL